MERREVLFFGRRNRWGLTVLSVILCFVIAPAFGMAAMMPQVLALAPVVLMSLLGFVGLMVPHAVRRFTGSEHRKLMPLSILAGALFVLLCDTAARSLFRPYELPVGIFLSVTGGPFFLFMLIKSGRRWSE